MTTKTCSRCGDTKLLDRFRKIGPARRHPWCKTCESTSSGARAQAGATTIHVPAEIAEPLRIRAAEMGLSPSLLARRFISEGLADMPPAGEIRLTRERTA